MNIQNSGCCAQKEQQVSRVVRNSGFAGVVFDNVTAAISEKSFNLNGFGRRFIPKLYIDPSVSRSVFSLFGIHSFHTEPIYGNFIGNHWIDGAAVHEHIDLAPTGFHHVRCNIALEMPQRGGYPVLNRRVLEIKTGDIGYVLPVSNGTRLHLFMEASVLPYLWVV